MFNHLRGTGSALNESNISKAGAVALTGGTLPPMMTFGCGYSSIPHWHFEETDADMLGLGGGTKDVVGADVFSDSHFDSLYTLY